MKTGWRKTTLGEAFTTATGNTPPKNNPGLFGNYIPLVKPPELLDAAVDSAEDGLSEAGSKIARVAPPKSILVSCIGNLGKIGLNVVPVAFNQQINAISPNESRAVPEFMFYQVLSSNFKDQLQSLSSGTTVSIVNKSRFNSIEVFLPPLPEQRRIVGILDEAFAGLATAKANAEKNLQNARALFESHLQSVFTQRGEGWVERQFGDERLLEIIDGDRGTNYPKAADFHDDGYCLFLNTKNVRPNGFEFESTMFITAQKDGQLRKGKLRRGDVVLTTRGTIGNVGYFSDDVPFEHIRINSGMLVLRANVRELLPEYLFELLRCDIVKDQIRRHTTGAAQPQLPIKTLVNFTIPIPTNLEDQDKLVKRIQAFEPETQRLESLYQQKLAALDTLKKSLLHQAFAGNL